MARKLTITYANVYYPFGMVTPGRSFSAGSGYRFGFNGKEITNEISGDNLTINFGSRYYDSRIGRFYSMDKFEKMSFGVSPYTISGNSPIMFVDMNGDFKFPAGKEAEYEKKYPALTNFLKNEVKYILESEELMNEFSQLTGISSVQLREALLWGSGPEIYIENPVTFIGEMFPGLLELGENSSGEYYRSINALLLNKNDAASFEMLNGIMDPSENQAYAEIGITLIHELMHYADWLDGERNIDVDEIGWEVENNLFGYYSYVVDGKTYTIPSSLLVSWTSGNGYYDEYVLRKKVIAKTAELVKPPKLDFSIDEAVTHSGAVEVNLAEDKMNSYAW